LGHVAFLNNMLNNQVIPCLNGHVRNTPHLSRLFLLIQIVFRVP